MYLLIYTYMPRIFLEGLRKFVTNSSKNSQCAEFDSKHVVSRALISSIETREEQKIITLIFKIMLEQRNGDNERRLTNDELSLAPLC
jgi:hypothetical protein